MERKLSLEECGSAAGIQVIIDEVGKVMKVWNKVKVPNHANEVLQYFHRCGLPLTCFPVDRRS